MAEENNNQPYRWTFGRVVWATLVFAFVVFCFWLIYRFYEVVFMVFISIVIGTVIRPVANWLYRHGIPKFTGVSLVYGLILALVAGFLWLLFPMIFEQTAMLAREVPDYYHEVRFWLLESSNPVFVRLGELLPNLLSIPGVNAAPQSEQGLMASAVQVLLYMLWATKILFIMIVILLLSLYWALDGPRLIKSALLLIPQDQRDDMIELITAMEARVGLYITGQGILAVVIGVLSLIAYVLIGLPNALVLAIAAGLMEVVPLIGPFLGAIPAGLVALSISPEKLIWVIVASIIIQQLENNLLVPRIMNRTVGVNPFVTLLSLFAFSLFFGIAGALMAIPVAAIIQLVLNQYVFGTGNVDMEISQGRDLVSRLRYEAHDLISDLRKQTRNRQGDSDEKIVQVEHLMDEIETITASLDGLLAGTHQPGAE
jgi:predicted PurR-regulated permease PerM